MVIDNKDCHKDTNNGDPCTHEKGPTKASYEGSGVCVSRAFQYGRRGGGNDVKQSKTKSCPELRCRIEQTSNQTLFCGLDLGHACACGCNRGGTKSGADGDTETFWEKGQAGEKR